MATPRLRGFIIFLQSVGCVLSVCVLLGRSSLAQTMTGQESTGFSFPQGSFHESNFTLLQDSYIGNATAPKQENAGNTLVLTRFNSSGAAGRALYSQPIQIRSPTTNNVLQFSVNFSFCSIKSLENSGEGIAFVMVLDNLSTGLPGGYLAWLNNETQGNQSSHSFAVEFDTGKTAQFDDQDDNHIGINFNSLNSTFATGSGFYAGPDYKSITQIDMSVDNPVYAWIDYNVVLSVTIGLNSSKPVKPVLSVPVNLSPIFNDVVYVGFTGSNIAFDDAFASAIHEVYDFSFQTGPDIGKAKFHTTLVVVVSILVPLAVVLLLIALCYSRSYWKSSRKPKQIVPQLTEYGLSDYPGVREMRYEDLKATTVK